MRIELMEPDVVTVEQRARLAPPRAVPTAPAAWAHEEACPGHTHGGTGQAANPAEALALAQAALQASRQAAAISVGIMARAGEIGVEADKATQTADHLQAEAEALLALAQQLTRLAQGLHDAAEDLRPSPARRRAALAENLQRFKAEHLALLRRAEAMLSGGSLLSPQHLVSAAGCGLGQWQQAAAQAGWGHGPDIQALERPHKAFHRALAGLLFAFQQGQSEAVAALYAELQISTDTIAALLDALCVSVLRYNDPTADEAG
jgi:hypothetical protein